MEKKLKTGWKMKIEAFNDIGQFKPGCRALWTVPAPEETKAPLRRVIHSRYFSYDQPLIVYRLGIRLGLGYFKCGSEPQQDWCQAFRVLVWQEGGWKVLRDEREVPRPTSESAVQWFDLGGISTTSLIVEVRRSGIDGWWTSWNLAMNGLLLETSELLLTELVDQPLKGGVFSEKALTPGLTCESTDTDIHFRSAYLEVSFRRRHPSFSYLALDATGQGKTQKNLLQGRSYMSSGSNNHLFEQLSQGMRLWPVGRVAQVGHFQRQMEGECTVHGNTVIYEVTQKEQGQQYLLEWTVLADRLHLRIVRRVERTFRAWASCAWQLTFATEVAATTTLGKITKSGESGLMTLPALLHVPGMGSFRIQSKNGGWLVRSDSLRPMMTTTLELKLGEVPQPEGDYLILAGEHVGEVEFVLDVPQVRCLPETPLVVQQALERCLHTSLPYRADAATLSNNGNSIHCTFCMDNWAVLAEPIGELVPGFHASELIAESLSRWLLGGPSYACGGREEGGHRFEDEYLHTAAGALHGLGLYLTHFGTSVWVKEHKEAIERELRLMRGRDLDQDGLVESLHRRGNSGEHQWSTNWWDVISFGWKDAFVNAKLYAALKLLQVALPKWGIETLDLGEWANTLKRNYHPTFFNQETGWMAGWKSHDGALHDYGFLFVNGSAIHHGLIEEAESKKVMRKLWDELKQLPISFRDGIPGNLRRISDCDTAGVQQGLPMGCYENGGLTLSYSNIFTAALYHVGMIKEGDELLSGLCSGLADGTAFGGCGTGVDWRRWNGSNCGYEGILSDQFTLLAVALERFGIKTV
jgi:hypothetical protein